MSSATTNYIITSHELDSTLETLHKIVSAAPDCPELRALLHWFGEFAAVCYFTASLSPAELLQLELALEGSVAKC